MSKVGNSVSFIGRLTKNPELKEVNDTHVCNFCLARNRDYVKDEDHPESDFVDCVAWGKTAEFIEKYFSKGSRIGVTGSLQTRTYKNQNDCTVKVTEIFVEQIEFIDLKSNSSNSEKASDSSDSYNYEKEETPKETPKDDAYSDDDGLPF